MRATPGCRVTAADTAVVVGAGQAGSELSIALRQNGFGGRIVLVGDERHLPYQRPPLSKGLLKEASSAYDVRVRAREAYAASGVELMLGAPVSELDLDGRCVVLADGTRISYTKLALTTGGRPRALTLGDSLTAASLYAFDDVRAVRKHLRPLGRVVVVGGGFIGLEVAAAAAAAGAEVTVVEAADRIMARTSPEVVSDFFASVHRRNGVSLHTAVSVVSATPRQDGRLDVTLTDNSCVSADLVLAGIGQVPNDELARAAGLEVADGIVVDSQALTSHPEVVAAGDCTRQFHGLLRRRVRLESQQNATEQARIAARTLCGSATESFGVPTFWSEQYEYRLQMAGMPMPEDEQFVLGDPHAGSFTVAFLRDEVLVAVQGVGRPRDIASGRKLIAAHARVNRPHDPTDDRPLADLVVT